MPAEWRTARQGRQPRGLREGPRPENGIMSPVVAAFLVPRGESGRNDGTIEANGVLLQEARAELESLIELSERFSLIRASALHLLGRKPA